MRFKFLIGDVNWKTYGGKFVSKKLNNGEFDYWIVMEVINMYEATGDESTDKYHVSLQAVSPEQVSREKMDSAISSCGWSDEDAERIAADPLLQVETLSDYGIYAPLWGESGNNLGKLLRLAHEECASIQMLFGFYMDRPANGIGQTGWDLIQGQNLSDFYTRKQV